MMQWAKNIYYRHHMPGNGLIKPIDWGLNAILKVCISSGIKKLESEGQYFGKVTFGNGAVYTYWNVNKYYAWLMQGKIVFPDTSIKYEYQDGRPTVEVMYDFMQLLKKGAYL